MLQEYTGFNDKNGLPIYYNSLVSTPRGIYIIKKDPLIDYCLVDVETKTVEKLTEDICPSLTRLVSDAKSIVNHL